MMDNSINKSGSAKLSTQTVTTDYFAVNANSYHDVTLTFSDLSEVKGITSIVRTYIDGNDTLFLDLSKSSIAINGNTVTITVKNTSSNNHFGGKLTVTAVGE